VSSLDFGTGDADELERSGPTIEAVVQAHTSQQATPRRYPALIDTGASETCIDAELAITLELPAVDRQPISTPSGQHDVQRHLALVEIPELGVHKLGIFPGVHLSAGGQQHRLLIGRDLLRQTRLVYDGPAGTGTLTFRP
jgi:predicted aspartyl protease